MRGCLILFLLLLSGSSFAQLRIIPLEQAPGKKAPLTKGAAAGAGMRKPGQSTANLKGAATTPNEALALPFWDDFSYWGYFVDESKWVSGPTAPGATITYGVAIMPPSWGVATFDGVDATGQPYSTTNTTGKTDSLASNPIDLSGLSAEEQAGLYLSFYWQRQGFGETPDARDALHLYFLDDNADKPQWHPVWSRTGASTTNPAVFEQEAISLKEAGERLGVNFIHPGFKFKFQSEGRQNGHFDQWHLDYVYLDKNRNPADPNFMYYRDVAISAVFPSLFSPYTSMPAHQFFANPAAYLPEQLEFTAFSFLPPGEEALYQYQLEVKTAENEPVFSTESSLVSTETGQFILGQEYFVENPADNPTPAHFQQFVGDTLIVFNTTVSLRPDERFAAPPLFLQNDNIQIRNELYDYYAYDDGIADAGISLGARGQRLAYRFNLEEQDTLTDVSFYFPNYANSSNRSLNLKIWTSLAGINGATEDVMRYTQFVTIPTEAPLDSMVRFTLKYPLVLGAGDFYVGYEQVGDGLLAVGFDLNTDSSPQIYHSVNTQDWLTYSQPGSIMIRPRFANQVKPESLSLPDHYFPQLRIYPNPTRDHLWVESEAQRLRLYDSQGRLLLQEDASPRTQLQLGHLQPGLYLLQLQYKTGIQSKRIILVR